MIDLFRILEYQNHKRVIDLFHTFILAEFQCIPRFLLSKKLGKLKLLTVYWESLSALFVMTHFKNLTVCIKF